MSRESKTTAEPSSVSPAMRQMVGLLEAEIARLQEELVAVRAGNHEQRRTMIVDRVARLDERQEALSQLQASICQTNSKA